jgi:pSer/pThr/pTyr-binding forkhead associated (FHA) protein
VEQAMGLRSGDEYELRDGATLGRGDRADIQLEDPFASSRHARISRQGDVLVIEDMGSTNGTYLNGNLLEGPQPLHPGDRVRIGDNEFCFVL